MSQANEWGLRGDAPISPPMPAWRSASPRATVFPLVVLFAVLPGLYGLKTWDLTPPSPWWGIRSLIVAEGQWWDQAPIPEREPGWPASEHAAYRKVALQPPLYAWLGALALWPAPDRAPVATVIPSYLAGAVAVMLMYALGRAGSDAGRGVGLLAAALFAFCPATIAAMQRATPTTLGLTWALITLLMHQHRLAAAPGRRGVRLIAGGLALGAGVLSQGPFALIVLPVIGLHYAYLRAEASPSERGRSGWRRLRNIPGLVTVAALTALAAAVALPWFVPMADHYGAELLAATLEPPGAGPIRDPLGRALGLAPALVPLAAYGAFRAIRRALRGDESDLASAPFWVIWAAVALLAPALWPAGPASAFDLFLLTPLTLLAAQAALDLMNRAAPTRALSWLVPATIACWAWESSGLFKRAAFDLFAGQASAATALALHLAVDLVLILWLLTRSVTRWARRRDDRARGILRASFVALLVAQAAEGLRELGFRHLETRGLLDLRDVAARRHRLQPFEAAALIGEAGGGTGDERALPGGRLRFMLRAALPGVPIEAYPKVDAFRRALADRPPPGPTRLVVLMGDQEDLPLDLRGPLRLEAIHPGQPDVLRAYATGLEVGTPGD